MLRVLNVAYPFAPVSSDAVGGAEQVLAAIDRALSETGHGSVVLAARGSQVRGELVAIDLPDPPLDERTRARAHERTFSTLNALLRSRSFDVLHFHGVDCAAYFPASAVPCIVTLHLPFDFYEPSLFERTPAPTFVCVSDAQRATIPRPELLRATIANGVDLDAFRPIRTRRGGYALCLGRISPEKAYDAALRAAHAAGVELKLAGQVFPYPDHERYFAERVAPLLDERRVFVGPVGGAAKRRLLANADCLVVPSQVAETSSLVTMEALASGTPVVVTPAGALPTLVEHGVTGFVAADEASLVQALRVAPRLDRAACRASAEHRFDLLRMTERYLRLYSTLARSKRTDSAFHDSGVSG